MQRTGRYVGRGAAMICNALDLDLVLVGGAVALGFGATFFNAAQLELDDYVHRPMGICREFLLPASLIVAH